MKRLNIALFAVMLTTLFGFGSLLNTWQKTAAVFPQPDLNNPQAAFIFTHQFAVSRGATDEWRKQEGVVIDGERHRLYMAISRTDGSMSDNADEIQMAKNTCGMVLVGTLDAQWNVGELQPLIIGGPYDRSTGMCNPDNIAEPDNLFVDGNGDLWIYEDTSQHKNGMVWKYSMADGTLRRFATAPLGGELTGLRIYNDTLFLNLQTPDSDNIAPFNRGTIGLVANFNVRSDFQSVPVAKGEAQRRLVTAAGEYQVLGQAGDVIPNNPNQQVLGSQFVNLIGSMVPQELLGALCGRPDGNMIIPQNAAGTALILYSDFECVPGGMSKLDLVLGADGRWQVTGGEMLDFSQTGGLFSPCNASVTPWNTALASEEVSPLTPDTWYATGYSVALMGYMATLVSPYDMGYVVEVSPQADGTTRTVKHYAMGRRQNEQAWVAPDERTVYFGDDGEDRVFYKFVATTAGDLSNGTLYAARVTQHGVDNARLFSFGLEWIELGRGDDAEVAAAIRAYVNS